jgi:hypothetical protein
MGRSLAGSNRENYFPDVCEVSNDLHIVRAADVVFLSVQQACENGMVFTVQKV